MARRTAEGRGSGERSSEDGSAVERMTALAGSSPPGAGGVLFLPYLQGERTPVWDPLARGVFLGITSATRKADLARAVFEGTAFALRQMMGPLDEVAGSPVGEVRTVGGGTKNALWNRIKADVLKRELRVLRFQETGTLGAALLAGMGAGVFRSFDEATGVARRLASDAETIAPDAERADIYDGLFDLYSRVYPATREIVHGLGGAGE